MSWVTAGLNGNSRQDAPCLNSSSGDVTRDRRSTAERSFLHQQNPRLRGLHWLPQKFWETKRQEGYSFLWSFTEAPGLKASWRDRLKPYPELEKLITDCGRPGVP